MKLALVIVALLGSRAWGAPTDVALPVEVRVSSSTMPEGGSFEDTFERIGDRYVSRNSTVDSNVVRQLVVLASRPPVETLEIERLGVSTPELLRVDPVSAWRAMRLTLDAAQRKRLNELLADAVRVEEQVRRDYASFWTHDHAYVLVSMRFEGGSTLRIESDVPHAHMIPWRIERDGRPKTTWEPFVGHAIAALIPRDERNAARLEGIGYAAEVAFEMGDRIADQKPDWMQQLQLSRGVAKDENPMARHFAIENELNGSLSQFGEPSVYGWVGTMFSREDAHIGFAVFLPEREPTKASETPFLDAQAAIVARMRKLPWVTRAVARHPQARIVVEFHGDRSVSRLAQKKMVDLLVSTLTPTMWATKTEELPRALSFSYQPSRSQSKAQFLLFPDGRGTRFSGPCVQDAPCLERGELFESDGSEVR